MYAIFITFMLGIGFVCFLFCRIMFNSALVCFWWTYAGLWVCLSVGELMFSSAFVFGGTYFGHWACLFVSWGTIFEMVVTLEQAQLAKFLEYLVVLKRTDY